MTGRACSICSSPRCEEIDAALAAGGRLVATAQEFGLSKSAVARHKANCLAPRLSAAARIVAPAKEGRARTARAKAIAAGAVEPTADDIASLIGLSARISRALDRLEGAADAAAEKSAYAALAALSGQVIRGVEAAGRLHGLYFDPKSEKTSGPAFTINIGIPPLMERGPPAALDAAAERPVWSPLEPGTNGGLPVPAMRLEFASTEAVADQ